MPYSTSVLAFDDVKDAFEKALEAPKGIRVVCDTRASAIVLRSRFNYYRKLDRQNNAKIYPPDHHLHNRSAYDKLIIRIPYRGSQEEATLYIVPRSIDDLTIEEIQ